MPVLFTSNFDDMRFESKMNKLEWRQYFPILSLWVIFGRSKAAYSTVGDQKFELVQDFYGYPHYLLSYRLCIFIVLKRDLFVYRDDSLTS